MNRRCTNVSNKVDWTLSRDSGVDWWWEDEPWAKSQLGVRWSGLVWGLIWLGSNKDKTQMSTWATFCTLLYSERLYSILLYSSELTPKWFLRKEYTQRSFTMYIWIKMFIVHFFNFFELVLLADWYSHILHCFASSWDLCWSVCA